MVADRNNIKSYEFKYLLTWNGLLVVQVVPQEHQQGGHEVWHSVGECSDKSTQTKNSPVPDSHELSGVGVATFFLPLMGEGFLKRCYDSWVLWWTQELTVD